MTRFGAPLILQPAEGLTRLTPNLASESLYHKSWDELTCFLWKMGETHRLQRLWGSGERADYLVITQLNWSSAVLVVGHEGKPGGNRPCVLHPEVWIVSFTCCTQTYGPPNVAPGPEFATLHLLWLMEENLFGGLLLWSSLHHREMPVDLRFPGGLRTEQSDGLTPAESSAHSSQIPAILYSLDNIRLPVDPAHYRSIQDFLQNWYFLQEKYYKT